MKPNFNFYLTMALVIFVAGMMLQSRMISMNLQKSGCKIDSEDSVKPKRTG